MNYLFWPGEFKESAGTFCWQMFFFLRFFRPCFSRVEAPHKNSRPKLSAFSPIFSGLQKGPARRGHVKKRQKSSKSVKKFSDTFRQFSCRAKNVKNRQKASNSFSTLFNNFRAAPYFRPLLGGSEISHFKPNFCLTPIFCLRRRPMFFF